MSRRHRYITQQQAAEYLDVTVRTIRNKISEGVLTGYRLPGLRAVRVDLEEIESKFEVIPAVVKPPKRPQFGPRANIVVVEDAGEDEIEGEIDPLGTVANDFPEEVDKRPARSGHS